MRGTQPAGADRLQAPRFIPAYAGNTFILTPVSRIIAVHPRICGEHLTIQVCTDPGDGSSPHMRGTQVRLRDKQQSRRFIPAYAGNTLIVFVVIESTSVHPRICGEHGVFSSHCAFTAGSSPHMRGTRHQYCSFQSPKRFIPAYAGNTKAHLPQPSPLAVHPRICGEHVLPPTLMLVADGSSPHMRGTLPAPVRRAVSLRFIPAYAGNTWQGSVISTLMPVHPRICGEHPKSASRRATSSGSSPHMRGTH